MEIGRVTQSDVGRRGRSTYNVERVDCRSPVCLYASKPSLPYVLTILGFPLSDLPGVGVPGPVIQTDVQQPADFTYEPAVLNPATRRS